MANNPASFRYPFENVISKLPPEHQEPLRTLFNAITDLYQASATNSAAIQSAPVSSSGSSSSSSTASPSASQSVTAPQAAAIAQTQALAQISSTFGKVNNQATTAYTPQQSDYAGLVTLNNAAATAVTLTGAMLPTAWFSAFENLGAGTATLTPSTGTINGLSNLPLTTGQGALVYYDGTNWWAVPIAGASASTGVTSLQGESGAITLTSSGSTVAITTPTGSTINLEATGGGGGVTSLQTETGAITLTSSGASVIITTPSSSTINLESTSGDPFNNSGTAPTLTLHGPAGSGASYTVAGNGTAGYIYLTAGTGASAGFIATVTIPVAFPTNVVPIVSRGFLQSTSVGFDFAGFSGTGNNNWELNAGTAMVPGQVYIIPYIVFGN